MSSTCYINQMSIYPSNDLSIHPSVCLSVCSLSFLECAFFPFFPPPPLCVRVHKAAYVLQDQPLREAKGKVCVCLCVRLCLCVRVYALGCSMTCG